MNDWLIDSGADQVNIIVSRAEVKNMDLLPALSTLRGLMATRERVIQFRDRVDIAFSGYDTDPREVFEIPEIRLFMRQLDEQFPFWFYFLNKRQGSSPVRTVAMCLCDSTRTPAGVNTDSVQLARFVMNHLGAMNHVFDAYGLDEADNEHMSEQIAELLCYGKEIGR